MSIDEEDALTESLRKKWDTERRRDSLSRMERKMHRKEQRFGHY